MLARKPSTGGGRAPTCRSSPAKVAMARVDRGRRLVEHMRRGRMAARRTQVSGEGAANKRCTHAQLARAAAPVPQRLGGSRTLTLGLALPVAFTPDFAATLPLDSVAPSMPSATYPAICI